MKNISIKPIYLGEDYIITNSTGQRWELDMENHYSYILRHQFNLSDVIEDILEQTDNFKEFLQIFKHFKTITPNIVLEHDTMDNGDPYWYSYISGFELEDIMNKVNN